MHWGLTCGREAEEQDEDGARPHGWRVGGWCADGVGGGICLCVLWCVCVRSQARVCDTGLGFSLFVCGGVVWWLLLTAAAVFDGFFIHLPGWHLRAGPSTQAGVPQHVFVCASGSFDMRITARHPPWILQLC